MAISLLAGCTSLRETMEGERIDYKSSGTKGPSLDVPPDLTKLSRDTRYAIPGTAVTASSYQIGQPTQAVTTAPNAVGDVNLAVLRLLNRLGVEIPYPQRVVHVTAAAAVD